MTEVLLYNIDRKKVVDERKVPPVRIHYSRAVTLMCKSSPDANGSWVEADKKPDKRR